MAPTARSLGNARLSMLAKPRTLTTRDEFAADIKREWANSLEAVVNIGRRLNQAKEALPHGEYEAMIANDLPFTPATGRKLRKVAELVDSGAVPIEQLPESYSTLYAIATMPEETRQQALGEGVIRPDVTRAELQAFKPPPAAAVEPVPVEIVERREGVRVTLEALFAGKLPPQDESASATIKPMPAPLPLLERTPAPVEHPMIEGEAVVVGEQLAATVLPTPAEPVKTPRRSRFAVALGQQWHTDPEDPGAILVELDGQKRILLVMVAPDPAAADIIRHVVDLHNASLEG